MVDFRDVDFEQQLRRARDRYDSDRQRITEQLAAATERRDQVVRQAAVAGLTRRKIADLAGISFQRVQQIVHGTDGDRRAA